MEGAGRGDRGDGITSSMNSVSASRRWKGEMCFPLFSWILFVKWGHAMPLKHRSLHISSRRLWVLTVTLQTSSGLLCRNLHCIPGSALLPVRTSIWPSVMDPEWALQSSGITVKPHTFPTRSPLCVLLGSQSKSPAQRNLHVPARLPRTFLTRAAGFGSRELRLVFQILLSSVNCLVCSDNNWKQ